MLRQTLARQNGGSVGNGIGRGDGIGAGAKAVERRGGTQREDQGEPKFFHGRHISRRVGCGGGFWMPILIYEIDSVSSHGLVRDRSSGIYPVCRWQDGGRCGALCRKNPRRIASLH